MRKNFIKGLALGMAVCMALVGCGTNSSNSGTGESKESQETTTEGYNNPLYPAYDFGGQTFTVFDSNDISGKIPGNTDDEFQKAERQEWLDYIQKKYNVKFEFVKATTTNWDEIPNELVAAYTAGKPLAEIMDLYLNYLGPVMQNNILVDMEDYFKGQTTYNPLNICTFLGGTFGITSPIAGEGLYYNIDMINDAGMEFTPAEMFDMGKWSYDDVYEYAVELKSKLGEGSYPLFIYPYYWCLFGSSANGVDMVEEGNNLCYLNNDFIELCEFCVKCINEGLSPIPLTETGSYNNWGYCGTTFDEGHTVAIAHRAAWQASGLPSKFTLGFVPYPWGSGVSIDESKVGQEGAYLTLSDDYKQTYYDGQLLCFLKGIEDKADPWELTSMMCEFMGWDWMLQAYDGERNTSCGWLEDDSKDQELYQWTRTRETWAWYNTLPLSFTLPYTKMMYENMGVRTTLQSAYQADMALMIEAGYATEMDDVE